MLRKHKIRNLTSLLLKRNGSLILDNGFKLEFIDENKDDIIQVFLLSIQHGAVFSPKKGFWNYEASISQISTPEGILFNIKAFDSLIFAETFIYDIHFSENLDGKFVIQAGGFIGDTALYYASKGARVYCFEADPNTYKCAVANIKLNPSLSDKITMENFAIGKDEYIVFPINEKGSGGSSVYMMNTKRTVQVKSFSISKILEEFKIDSPYLLDLDIKGKEFDVINESSIAKFQKVRIEYSQEYVGLKTNGRDLLINKLKDHGFKTIRIFKHNFLVYDVNYHGTIEASNPFSLEI